MPDQWVSGDGLTMEAQLEHERRVARRLREAYRLAETRSTEAREELRKLRAALEALGLTWERACTEASAVPCMRVSCRRCSMSTLADLRPGDIGFSNITGYAGALIWAAQRVLAATEKSEAKIKHVFVVTQAGDYPRIVQAMPHGAEEIEIGDEHWTKDFVYLRPAYTEKFGGTFGINVAHAAQRYIDTPYSFADYAAILGLHMGIDNGAVRRYVTSSGHQICSQLADQALSDAGFHVFTDKRLPQDVMPIELYRALAAMPGTLRLIPDVTEGFSRPGEW